MLRLVRALTRGLLHAPLGSASNCLQGKRKDAKHSSVLIALNFDLVIDEVLGLAGRSHANTILLVT